MRMQPHKTLIDKKKTEAIIYIFEMYKLYRRFFFAVLL